jgi:hypothetical protein
MLGCPFVADLLNVSENQGTSGKQKINIQEKNSFMSSCFLELF